MQKKTPLLTPKSFFRTYALIHLSMVGGVLLFALIIFLQTKEHALILSYNGDKLFFIVPIMAILGIVAGNYIYQNILKKLASKNTLTEKLSGIQTAALIKYALIEAPALLSVTAFMHDGNLYFLIITLVLAGWLILQKPTRDKIVQDLKLEGNLKNQFQQQDQPVT
ncbi:hypothetical protein [Aequorivita sp. Q41]|uniref:hypothetical protein n=1 Tax=Aequorivita sp. Q41 TaxID=3153300 RepID=UPI0032429248